MELYEILTELKNENKLLGGKNKDLESDKIDLLKRNSELEIKIDKLFKIDAEIISKELYELLTQPKRVGPNDTKSIIEERYKKDECYYSSWHHVFKDEDLGKIRDFEIIDKDFFNKYKLLFGWNDPIIEAKSLGKFDEVFKKEEEGGK